MIPAYNRPQYLVRAVISALWQTYKILKSLFVMIVQIMKCKRLFLFLNRYPQIKYVKNEKNLFLENWHKCYELASGEYINFLMDDDLFHKEKIEK